MPDVSEWNERERDAATRVVDAYANMWSHRSGAASVPVSEVRECMDAMLRAVDAVRREPAEPVNTIKLDPKTGDVARCMSRNGVRFWAPLILMPPPAPGEALASLNVDNWVTIHDPSKVVIRVDVGPKPVAPIRIARKVDILDGSCRGSRWIDNVGDVWRWDGAWLWLNSVSNEWHISPADTPTMCAPYREIIPTK